MLPQYSKQYKSQDVGLDDGASEPFLTRTSTETAPPTYPPSTSGTGVRSNVQYIYDPVYPRRGKRKTAVGVMGRTKLETIQIIQKGFPELAEFDDERISFLNGDDAVIFEEAWEHFGTSPPEKLKVIVADGPGEEAKRERRKKIIISSILGGVLLYFLIATVLILLFAT